MVGKWNGSRPSRKVRAEGDVVMRTPPQVRRPLPQPRGRDIGALAQRPQLLPSHGRIDFAVAGEGTEAAIRAGHDALLADDIGEPLDALRDEFRMFDIVGAGVD